MTPDQVRGRLWAQRLKRVFGIDIETCPACGGAVKVIACIEDPVVIKRILDHLKQTLGRCAVSPGRVPACREVGKGGINGENTGRL